MSTITDRVFNALGQFNGRLSAFVQAVTSTTPDPPRLPAKTLKELSEIAARARTGTDAISRSFTLIDVTALDIVDMQVRLQGETARLAAALRDLGDAVQQQHFVREAFEDELVALDEASHLLAAAVFPSAVQGLREANVKLWDFQKIQWKRYTDILNDVVQRGRIPSDQQARIQAIADDVARAFEEVNTLLNDLAESRATDAASLRRRLKQAPDRLRAALQTASDRLEQSHSSTLSAFGCRHQGVGQSRRGCCQAASEADDSRVSYIRGSWHVLRRCRAAALREHRRRAGVRAPEHPRAAAGHARLGTAAARQPPCDGHSGVSRSHLLRSGPFNHR
jgi:ElaB/YqjD/DUF883 family membrane-anchored ribosome-binding protein